MTRKTPSMTITRRRFLGSSLAAGALGVGLPSWAIAQTSVENGRLRAHLFADISNLDPAFWTSAADAQVMVCIFAFSMMFETGTDTFTAIPSAFRRIEQIDDTHVEFELHEGILYSGDYGEMTAEDAKFSWERIADPAVQSPYAGDWEQLDHVEVTGRYTGTIVLKAPFAPLFTSTLPAPGGIILPRAAIEAAGGQFSTEPPVTSGPYRIREWQPRTRLVLERNPDFTLFDVEFDEIELIPIEDARTAELGYEAGDLDYVRTSISSIPRYLESVPGGGSFARYTGLSYNWLGMNEENEALSDIRVRRALQHAISREVVVEATYLGAAEPAAGIVAPGLPGHRAENLYNYDPDLARQLLDEAGVSGLNITLSIQQTAENLAAAQVIQALLADVGVTVRIDQYDAGTFWSLGDESAGDQWRDLQLFLFSFSMQPDPSWATVWFTTAQVGIWNWQRFSDAEFDRLNSEGATELDPERRAEMYVRMQDLMEESGDFVFLNFEPVGILTAPGIVRGVRPDGTAILPGFGRG